MTLRTRRFAAYTLPMCAGIVVTSVWFAWAGDLNPPAGPVAPTHKTLTDLEPRIAVNSVNTPGDGSYIYKINQPGSYYLTGNITGAVGMHGIGIAVSGVTLDLNGFDLVGVPGMGAFDGVRIIFNDQSNIAVVNGSVRNWGRDGVNLSSLGQTNCRVANVLASGNANNGIVTGDHATITNCSANSNAIGIFAFIGGTVTNCSASMNSDRGIFAQDGAVITDCSASLNTGSGIVTTDGCTISNCTAYDNNVDGIHVNSGCVILGCTVYRNSGSGINISTGSTVAHCSVRLNTLDGILGNGSSVIRDNTCSSNGLGAGVGAGIHVTQSDNRIEGNNCTGADRGIDVDVSGNIIIKNTCSGNTTANWDIVAGNVCLVVQGVTGAAILGNTGGVAPGSTDPGANFTF